MLFALWLAGAVFIGLMGGLGFAANYDPVKWSDAVSAFGSVVGAIGTVGTLIFLAWQNFLSRRDLLAQRLTNELGEWELLSATLKNILKTAEYWKRQYRYFDIAQEWSLLVDPGMLEGMRGQVERVRAKASIPAVDQLCDGALGVLGELHQVHAFSDKLNSKSKDHPPLGLALEVALNLAQGLYDQASERVTACQERLSQIGRLR